MWAKFWSYLKFWEKASPDSPSSFNLKIMHGINKISILMFVIALFVIIYRLVHGLFNS